MTQELLARASAGDEQAFRELTDPHRRELHVHCYRMLGSAQDAEDVLQETLLQAWRSLGGFEARASVRTWLYRIATNRCLNARRDASRRPRTVPAPAFDVPEPTRMAEPGHLEPYPDALLDDAETDPHARYERRESIELAFIVALQALPARQRAALVLRDVLGYRAREVAAMLDTTEESVKAALKRARATLERARPHADPPPPPDSPQERAVLDRFVEAFHHDDIEALLAMFTEDGWVRMPPAPFEYQGHPAIREFFLRSTRWRTWRHSRLVPTRANGQPAFARFDPDPHTGALQASGLYVLTLEGSRLADLTAFVDTSVFAVFGLDEARSAAEREGFEPSVDL